VEGQGAASSTAYAITVTQGENGTISPDTQSGIISGSNVSFAITPTTEYDIATLMIDGQSVATSTTYDFTNITSSHTIAATFVAKPSAEALEDAPTDPAVLPVE
jgi:hypothetical protein